MCKCGNQACAVREARGLTAFCQMAAPVRKQREGFGSYAAAVAARQDGQKVLRIGNCLDGGPKRFVLVAA